MTSFFSRSLGRWRSRPHPSPDLDPEQAAALGDHTEHDAAASNLDSDEVAIDTSTETGPETDPNHLYRRANITFRQDTRGERRRFLLNVPTSATTNHNTYRDGQSSEDEADEADDDTDQHWNNNSTSPTSLANAERLDNIPVYVITHTIRHLVLDRVETAVSWDQLRSPQMTAFLVKPLQQTIVISIQHSHSHTETSSPDDTADGVPAAPSAATLYALLANCVQFRKEADLDPTTLGISHTRAMMCELLAIRMLREYSPRKLVDALSYDFHPFRGHPVPLPGPNRASNPILSTTRVSAIEIAILAEAKRFLAHPAVVRHLEGIWAGTIVFHAATDSIHRQPHSHPQTHPHQQPSFGTFSKRYSTPPTRTISIYSFSHSSLFKLSRLRVGRYRQFFSTLSFALMLALLTRVLARRSVPITPLEIIFFFFSSGFVLAEISELTAQGSGLFFLSYWNGLGLVSEVLFIVYYALRIYSFLILPTEGADTDPDMDSRPSTYTAEWAANTGCDVLAAAAVLLFPRLFSVLDHYYYFSQLLIALRAMIRDLLAVMLLILISCSGFLVAFTYSFRVSPDHFHGSDALYALFQLLMGYTPAAWDMWADLNVFGRFVLVIFLFICHFLIVTVLITVLTNSFMGVVRNAEEEHQYLFAINTLSKVKTNPLFSYVPPINILGFLLSPTRYLLPFHRFVRLNRQVIKVTHLPILAAIMLYERAVLSGRPLSIWHHTNQPPAHNHPEQPGNDQSGDTFLSVRRRVRAPSNATQQHDAALDAVFSNTYTSKDGRSRLSANPPPNHENEADVEVRKASSVGDWIRRVPSAYSHGPERQMSIYSRTRDLSRPSFATGRSIVSEPEGVDLMGTPQIRPVISRGGPLQPVPTTANATTSHPSKEDEDGSKNGDDKANAPPHSQSPPNIPPLIDRSTIKDQAGSSHMRATSTDTILHSPLALPTEATSPPPLRKDYLSSRPNYHNIAPDSARRIRLPGHQQIRTTNRWDREEERQKKRGTDRQFMDLDHRIAGLERTLSEILEIVKGKGER